MSSSSPLRILSRLALRDRNVAMRLKIYRHRSRRRSTRYHSSADSSRRKILRPRKLLRYFVASQYRFSATAICDFFQIPFAILPRDFHSPQESSYFAEYLRYCTAPTFRLAPMARGNHRHADVRRRWREGAIEKQVPSSRQNRDTM